MFLLSPLSELEAELKETIGKHEQDLQTLAVLAQLLITLVVWHCIPSDKSRTSLLQGQQRFLETSLTECQKSLNDLIVRP